jgi:hypothetical protein
MQLLVLAKALGLPQRLDAMPLLFGILPVAEPEVAFDWIGAADTSGSNQITAIGATTTLVTITISKAGFYVVDAAATVLLATAGSNLRRLAFAVIDDNGNDRWVQAFGWTGPSATTIVDPTILPTMRLFLKVNWLLRWRSVEAQGASDVAGASIATRLLYQG